MSKVVHGATESVEGGHVSRSPIEGMSSPTLLWQMSDEVEVSSSMPSEDLLAGVKLLQSVAKKGNASRGM